MMTMTDHERGTTIIEMLVVLSMSALLAVPLLGVVQSATRIEEDQITRIDVRSKLDRALTEISDDIRLSVPNADLASSSSLGHTLPLSANAADGSQTLTLWVVGADGLERVVHDAATLRETQRSVFVAEVVPVAGMPSFSYFDSDGDELQPRTTPIDTLVNCTALIRVTLAADAGSKIVTSSVDVALRSREPGGNGC